MPSHNVHVKLESKGASRHTPIGAVNRIAFKGMGGGSSSPQSLSQQISSIQGKQDTAFVGVATGASVFAFNRMKRTANKVADLRLDWLESRHGSTMAIGNFRRVKDYVLNPSSYLIDVTYGRYLRDLEISRQNISNDYYRGLTGEIIVGNQYGTKR